MSTFIDQKIEVMRHWRTLTVVLVYFRLGGN